MEPIKIKSIEAIGDHVLVSDMNFKGRTLSSGIIVIGDDGRTSGIRPRWAEVYAVGPDQRDIQVGQWILVAHGRWTRGTKIEDDSGVHVIRRIDPEDILLISDEPMTDDTLSSAVLVDKKER